MIGIYSIQQFSTLDFPGRLCAIVWFSGCNMRCPYCYNKDVVYGKKQIDEDVFFKFLKSRIGLLDGVSITGGEATLYPKLYNFIKTIKELGFEVKLDTNGINFEIIKKLVDDELVDYFALDFKAPKDKFYQIAKNENYDKFEKTLQYLIDNNMDFEVRTTIHTDLINENDVNTIIEELSKKEYKGVYYLQNYFETTKETIGNVSMPTKKFDTSKILNKIPIEFRNF